MNAHTPGPWYVEVDHSDGAPEFIRAFVHGEMHDIASMLCDETGQAVANARLIAAAPALLAALQEMLKYAEGFEDADHVIDARAAIAAATEGEE